MHILKRPWTIRSTLTSTLLASLGTMAAVMLIIGLVGWRQIVLSTATEDIQNEAEIAELKLKNLINPAATAIRIIGEHPLQSRNLGPEYKYLPAMVQELRINKLITGVYIGFSNGDFIGVRSLIDERYRKSLNAPDNAGYLLQLIINNDDGTSSHTFDFYDYKNQLIESRAPEFDLKLAERPWYQSALEKPGLNISSPYVFFSTKQVGLTLSKQSTNGQAVIGMDIALEDLGDLLDSIKLTPNTELAIVSKSGNLVGYHDLENLLNDASTDQGEPKLPKLSELGANPLVQAYDSAGQDTTKFESGDQQWLGVTSNLGKNMPMQMVIAVPMHELLGEAYTYIRLMLILAIAIILIMFAWSWWAGGKLSGYLDQLVSQAQSMARFDFTKASCKQIPIREIVQLQSSANNVSKTLESILSIGKILGTESDIDTMLQKVLVLTVGATHCVSGTVYIWDEDLGKMYKSASYGTYEYPKNLAYDLDTGNIQTTNEFIQRQAWFELSSRSQELQGLLVLETDNTKQELYGEDFHAFVNRLTGMLEVTIEARQLINAQKDLFYGMIHMLADAIDAKSPYTGGHCKRVPQLAIMMIDDMQASTTGKYASFNLSEQELKEFSLAAWLHDCGKLVIPQDIVDKASKLEMIYNRIHEIRMRFEVLLRDAEINYLKQLSKGDEAQALEQYQKTKAKLLDDYEFVARCNIGSEYLDEESIQRLQAIGEQEWLRNFDDLIGLPEVELKQRILGRTTEQNSLPATEKLLANRPFDQVHWSKGDLIAQLNHDHPGIGLDMDQPELKQNTGELHNLTVRRGTLTEEDRFIIQNHMVQTLLMLHKLPWPNGFKDVPNIASNHHERIDGQGYPRRLHAGELPISHRVLAIADVFEALTASDRPYKDTKTVSESLFIMANMCLEQHLDKELFIYFLENKIWLEYGQKFLKPQQIDDVAIEQIKGLLVG